MKYKLFFLAALLLSAAFVSNAQQLNIATFNLRYDNKHDTGNLWVDRVPNVAGLIQFHDFDIFGTQEGLQNQLDDLSAALPGYTYYGIGRDDGKTKGEHSAIFYKTAKFKVLDKGDFWLSETPEKPGPGWDAHLNRICSWIHFQDIKTKKKFYFFNVHFDHQGIKAREESSKLVLQKIQEIAGKGPAIFTGDLNGGRESTWYQTLENSDILEDSYKEAKQPYAPNGSFNGFGSRLRSNQVIDHIFLTDQFAVKKWGILTDSYHGKFPSDHFPVQAIISYK